MRTKLAFLAAIWLLSSAANAQDAEKCKELATSADRLACLQAVPLGTRGGWQGPVQPSPRFYRAQAAQAMQNAFLKEGADVSVTASEALNEVDFQMGRQRSELPQLVIFAAFGKPFVYKMITEGRVLEKARELGFRGVDFHSKYDGHWYYPVSATGDLPRCDRMNRLCY